MTSALMQMSLNETTYKQAVDQANTFLVGFRRTMTELCKRIYDLEALRMEQIHASINQFVVYETSAEMNNKYDIGNFAKLLE